MDYLRIWADDEGETHLEEVTLPRTVQPTSVGTAQLHLSPHIDVSRILFTMADTVDQIPDWHRAPRRQFVVFLDGWVKVETSDGDERTLPAGGVVLAEDVEGKGHVTTLEVGVKRILQIPLEGE